MTHDAAGDARGDHHVADLDALGFVLGADALAQLGDPLGQRVLVEAGVEPVFRLGLDGIRHVEIRLADAEVDGGLELLGQVEHLADAGGVERAHAFGEPCLLRVGHSFPRPRWK
jgi:hypothetical protein